MAYCTNEECINFPIYTNAPYNYEGYTKCCECGSYVVHSPEEEAEAWKEFE